MTLSTMTRACTALMVAAVIPMSAPASATTPAGAGLVLFERFDTDQEEHDTELYAIDPAGGEPQPLTSNRISDCCASWSPDGSRVAFIRDGDIWTMSSRGNRQRRRTRTKAAEDAPEWSPDGRKIAFVRKRHLFVMRANGRRHRRIAVRGRLSAPSWSPNGRKLAFVRVHTYEQNGLPTPELDIYVSRLDGSRLRNLTPGKDRFEWGFDPDWSPDGRRIAYARGDEGCGSIFVMRANGRKDKRVTPDECGDYQHRSPEWSPQGDAIAYIALHDTGECGGPDELRIERLGSEDDVTLVSQCSAGIRNVSWQRL